MSELPPRPKSPHHCPRCGEPGSWRQGGPEFAGEMRCDWCSRVWAPYEIELELQRLIRNSENRDGAGI